MEEELISFETAKEIPVNFDIFCLDGFDFRGDPTKAGNHDNLYRRPSQSILQRWFREEHQIHIHPSYNPESNDYSCHIAYTALKDGKYIFNYGTVLQLSNGKTNGTYEEVLEEGLHAVLLVIKKK